MLQSDDISNKEMSVVCIGIRGVLSIAGHQKYVAFQTSRCFERGPCKY